MRIFCSGIGGIGLSAYAAYQKACGHSVTGSDRADSALLRDLASQGIAVSLTQDGSAVPADADLFVYSEAIPPESPERRCAKERGIPEQSYFQALGEISKSFRVIAICGTHGKSSTTAMAARLLMDAGRDPSVIVGTKMRELKDRNWRKPAFAPGGATVGKGGGKFFVVEACEYRRSFLHLSPSIILLTNADGDHFDYYRSQEDYESAFVSFVRSLPAGDPVILHGGDPVSTAIGRQSGREVLDADALALPELSIPGMHMRQNARLVLALARELGIPEETARRSLAGYRGCWRRMEVKGEAGGVTVIDDYGHHPAEIRATLSSLLEAYPGRRLVVVFQPHTHDRTLKLYGDFTRCFSGAGVVIVPNVYGARPESETATVDVERFVRAIAARSGTTAIQGRSLEETERLLREEILRPGDVLLVQGAGDVTALASKLVEVEIGWKD